MRLETIIKEISEDPRNEEFMQRGIFRNFFDDSL